MSPCSSRVCNVCQLQVKQAYGGLGQNQEDAFFSHLTLPLLVKLFFFLTNDHITNPNPPLAPFSIVLSRDPHVLLIHVTDCLISRPLFKHLQLAPDYLWNSLSILFFGLHTRREASEPVRNQRERTVPWHRVAAVGQGRNEVFMYTQKQNQWTLIKDYVWEVRDKA